MNVSSISDDAWLSFNSILPLSADSQLDSMIHYPNFDFGLTGPPLPHGQSSVAAGSSRNSGSSTPPRCSCLISQLSCIASLVSVDSTGMGLDGILARATESTKALSEQIDCTECNKGTWSFVLDTIILQRLMFIFCTLASCKKLDIKSVRLTVGSYELSEEEDLAHKKMLALSALKGVESVLDRFRDSLQTFCGITQTARDLRRTPLTNDRLNLSWASEGLEHIAGRMHVIRNTIEAENWRKSSKEVEDSSIWTGTLAQ